jgi:glutamate dehydrogenase/leucine dehydrogenase
MRVQRLQTVDAMIAFDFECPTSAGGTRLAPDVTEEEVRLLARAMTYKFASLEVQVGGAKAAIRARPESRAEAVRSYCDEIRPLVEQGTFLTATDLGTFPEDFASLPSSDAADLMHEPVDGMPFDAFITGLGVVVAAETALGGPGSLEGRTLALEGFGKIGGATARALEARGGRLVAVSTVHGCARDPRGFTADGLLELRERHGDRLVEHLGVPVRPAAAVFEAEADVLVPGARTGVLDEATAGRVRASVVAPAANVPYAAAGLAALRSQGVLALADFVCNAGATVGYLSPDGLGQAGVLERVEARVRQLTETALRHPEGPYAGACAFADAHLRTWLNPEQLPDGPPLA